MPARKEKIKQNHRSGFEFISLKETRKRKKKTPPQKNAIFPKQPQKFTEMQRGLCESNIQVHQTGANSLHKVRLANGAPLSLLSTAV